MCCNTLTTYAMGAGHAPTSSLNRTPAPAPAPTTATKNPQATKTPTPQATSSINSTEEVTGSIDSYLEKNKWSAKDVKNMIALLKRDGDYAQKKAIKQLESSYENKTTMMISEIFNDVEGLNLLGNNSGEAGSNFSAVYKLFAIIGYALIALYFVIALIEKASTAQMTIEQFLHILLKVVIAKAVIENGWTFISKFYSAGLGIAQGIETVAFGSTDVITDSSYLAMADTVREIAENGYFANIFTSFDYSGWTVLALACSFIASVVVWGLIIEIAVKSILAPLAFAEIVTSGIHGSGMRYLKRLFILDLQFAAILLTTYVCGIINVQISLSSTYTTALYSQIIIQLVTVFSIVKASSYVNDILKS